MNKKCLIVCWYGKLPEYFKFWELSCSYNQDYDFLVFTDQDYKSSYRNVKIINKSMIEMKDLFANKLDLDIKIEKPYKFCDFRPAYGIIFDDYLKQYDFWGHCDIDQIFGNISTFITDDVLSKYDKINQNGHFSLYRNNEKINNLFKKDSAKFSYKEVFSNKEHYAFDEFTGINRIVLKEKIKLCFKNNFADIDVKHKRYTLANLPNHEKQVFAWENGKIFKYYLENNEIKKEELMYLHFQKKKANIISLDKAKTIIIGSNGIDVVDNITEKEIDKYNPYLGQMPERIEKIKYYFTKINEFIKCSKKQKIVWLKQKFKG